MDRAHVALALMAPAPFVFGLRALLHLGEWGDVPGYWFAIVGILGSVGMLTLLVSTWKTPAFTKVAVAIGIAFLGHYVVDRFINEGLGNAMVYLGTGFAASLWTRFALYAGLVAATGALLRDNPAGDAAVDTLGNGLLFVGAWALAGLLVQEVVAGSAKSGSPSA